MRSHGTGFIIIQRYMRTRNIYLDTYHVSTANIPVGQVDGKRLLLPSTLATWRSRLATPTLLLVSLKKRLRYLPNNKVYANLISLSLQVWKLLQKNKKTFTVSVSFSGYFFWLLLLFTVFVSCFTVSVLRFCFFSCNDSVSAAVIFFVGCGPWREIKYFFPINSGREKVRCKGSWWNSVNTRLGPSRFLI